MVDVNTCESQRGGEIDYEKRASVLLAGNPRLSATFEKMVDKHVVGWTDAESGTFVEHTRELGRAIEQIRITIGWDLLRAEDANIVTEIERLKELKRDAQKLALKREAERVGNEHAQKKDVLLISKVDSTPEANRPPQVVKSNNQQKQFYPKLDGEKKLISSKEVCKILKCRRTAFYGSVRNSPDFPAPIRPLGKKSNSVVWWEHEVLEYLDRCPRG